jgi:purine-binding chemotaxis protein CheW
VGRTGRGKKKQPTGKDSGKQSPEAAWESLTADEGPPATAGGSSAQASAGAAMRHAEGGGPPEVGLPAGDPGARGEGETPFPTEKAYEQRGWSETDGMEVPLDLLCFTLAEEEFAIDIEGVWEIIRMRPATEIPRVPSFIRGIISLRGVIVPVVDLRLRLGFEPPESALPSAKIIVASFDGKSVGMAVDDVTSKARVSHSNVDPPPAVLGKSEAGFLLGVCRHQGRLISVLNTAAVLGLEQEDHSQVEGRLATGGGES